MSEAVQTSTAKERREENFLLDKVCGKPLAKHEQKGYVNREPRLLLAGRNRGWHGAVNAPVHDYQDVGLLSTPTHRIWAGVNSYSA